MSASIHLIEHSKGYTVRVYIRKVMQNDFQDFNDKDSAMDFIEKLTSDLTNAMHEKLKNIMKEGL